ncbi:MAG: deoxyribose-phosphate aldolase [Pyrinomonadaceae bacterium]
MMKLLRSLAKMIDHSLLHPTMTDAELGAGCDVAWRCDVATVCIKPYAIALACDALAGSDVGVCTVVAFPHGNSATEMKVRETAEATSAGATEIDVVINIGKTLGGDWDYVSQEIKAVNEAAVGRGALLKVIFENDYLQNEHIIRLCEICAEHNVAFVKTSTGYGFVKQGNGMYSYRGAIDEHLRLMRQHSPESVQVKAAGGVRTLDDLLRVRALGVTRIGATATSSMLDEARRRGFE